MFSSLSDRLESILKKLKGRGFLKEEDIDAAMKEVRIALLEADVNFKVVKGFISGIKERAIDSEVLESLTPGQQVVKIVLSELTKLLGGESGKIKLAANPPTIIMLTGLQGSGKTTTAAKIAAAFKKDGRRPMMVAADLQRPAAIQQLITLGEQTGIPVHYSMDSKDPVAVCSEAVSISKKDGRDILILDTAGRLHVDEELMGQLRSVKDAVSPHEVLFVADAMTGQDAVNSATAFNEQIGIDGVVLTKMDGDARGGAALSIRSVTGKPIKYMGTGEKIEMLEQFHPDRVANRILGMGDVMSLIEKAEESFDAEEALSLQDKMTGGGFTFEDLRDQLKKIRSMGSLESLLGMIPGMSKQLKGAQVDDRELIKVEAIINSMTPRERASAKLLNGSRKRRIALGSGTTPADVNRLIKQHKQMKKMMKMFKKKGRVPQMPFMGQ
ncbi:MAG: signal recognition particle protein [Thermodesulfovibrionales bacterium]|nr:signal recognition particle protein [Thermodesulfovibrionales bacterium]